MASVLVHITHKGIYEGSEYYVVKMSVCNHYRGISLLSVLGKVYGRVLTERLMKVTEEKVSEEQGARAKDV